MVVLTSLQVGHYSSIMVEPTTNISLQQRKSRKEGSESDMVLLYSYVLHIIAYATFLAEEAILVIILYSFQRRTNYAEE